MKNILILILTVLCGILAYLQFGIPKEEAEPCPACAEPEVIEKVVEKISPFEVVKMASVHGLTLETKTEDVDAIIEEHGFKCQKQESKPEAELKDSFANWTCAHDVLDSAALRITSVGGEINHIGRSGGAYETDMDDVLNHLEDLKIRLNTLDGFNTSQDKKNLTFQIHHTKEDARKAFVKYHMHYSPNHEEEKKPGKGGVLTVVITR